MFLLAAAAMVMGATADVPRPAPAPAIRSARTGYPKLFRCASPIAQPINQPEYSATCRTWRAAELARIAALPVPARIERVTALRDRMGLDRDQGLGVTPDGALVPAQREFVSR